jgi:hypothetical protein
MAFNSTWTLPNISGALTQTGFSLPGTPQWCTNADGTGTCWNQGATYTHDVVGGRTLYAVWQYTVTYDGNGRTGGAAVPGNTTCFKGRNCTIATLPAMTRTNHTLNMNHWNTAANASGTNHASGLTTFQNAAGNVTLFAQWTGCAACGAGTVAACSGNSSVTCILTVENNQCTYATDCCPNFGPIVNGGTANPSCNRSHINFLGVPDRAGTLSLPFPLRI